MTNVVGEGAPEFLCHSRSGLYAQRIAGGLKAREMRI